jgi:hypothetical protein
LAAKCDQCDLIAPDVAIGQQQLDRPLDFGKSLQCRGAGSVDDEDRRGRAALLEALDAEVFLADQNACRSAGFVAR